MICFNGIFFFLETTTDAQTTKDVATTNKEQTNTAQETTGTAKATTDTAKETTDTKSGDKKTTDTKKTTAKTTNTLNESDIPDATQASPSDNIPDAGNTKTTKTVSSGTTKTATNKETATTTQAPKSTSAKDTNVYVGFSTTIDPRLPAGTISLKTPALTESTYIKIGQFATFEWNYVSLSVTPRKLNIQAYCSYNSETYTVATDHPSAETSYVWDTEAFQANATIPLLTAQYNLQIYDSEANMTVIAQAGYLAPFSQKFYMYSPQAYTPWSGKCNFS